MLEYEHNSGENSTEEIMKPDQVIKPEESNQYVNDRKYVPLRKITGNTLFEKFLSKCVEVVKPGDELSRVLEKVQRWFNEADPSYRDSPTFGNFLLQIIPKVATEPWQCMKNVADSLKNHSVKKTKKQATDSTNTIHDPLKSVIDPKIRLLIRKLELTLAKLSSKIQFLEREEINFEDSDDENSNYIRVSRYKKRFCETLMKIHELKKIEDNSSSNVIRFSGTRIPSVNRAIERFYNDKKEFPDFHDILNVVRVVNDRKNLGFTKAQIHETAKTAFEELGQTLKLQRQYEFYDIMCTYLPVERDDPADVDNELEQKLSENKRLHGHKIDDVINKYAILQEKNRSESEEVESDEESLPLESEEDDENKSVTSVSEYEMDDLREDVRDCSVKLKDVTKLPIWETYRKRLRTQDTVELSGASELNEPCCSKSLVSLDVCRKRKESELDPDSGDSDASEPKRGKFIAPELRVSSIRSLDCKRIVEEVPQNEDVLEIVEIDEKTSSRERSKSNDMNEVDEMVVSAELSERLTNHETDVLPKRDVVLRASPSVSRLKDESVGVDSGIQSSKRMPTKFAADSELIPLSSTAEPIASQDVAVTSELSARDTENSDSRYHNEVSEANDDEDENDGIININCGPSNSTHVDELKSRNIEDSVIPSKCATRCEPNANVGSIAVNKFHSPCSAKNVPTYVSSASKNKDNDDDVVILDDPPSVDKSPESVSSTNEIIDVDELENSPKSSRKNFLPPITLGSFIRNLNGKNELSTSGRLNNVYVHPLPNYPRYQPNLQPSRRTIPNPGNRLRMNPPIRFSMNRAQNRPTNPVLNQRIQINRTLHKRTTQTNEIRYVQSNGQFAAKRTTTVEESLLQVSTPRVSLASSGGFSKPLRDYNSPNSTFRNARGSRRVSQCVTTQRSRTSPDEVVTLD